MNLDSSLDSVYERTLLGSVLLHRSVSDVLEMNLEPEHFLDRRNKVVFSAILELFMNGEPISIYTVVDSLRSKDMLEISGGPGYIASLTDEADGSGFLQYYVHKIIAAYEKSMLYHSLCELKDKIERGIGTNEDFKVELSQLSRFTSYKSQHEPLLVFPKSSHLAPPDWLVHGWILKNTSIVFYGEPKSFKTFLVLSLAFSVATGKDFFGAKCERNNVIYVIGEGLDRFDARLIALQRYYGITMEHPCFLRTERSVHFRYKSEFIQLKNEIRKSNTHPGLIVIDTLNKNFGADGSPDNSKDFSQFMEAADELRNEYKCAIILVHHTGHGEKKRPRGTSAILGDLDYVYRVEKIGNAGCKVERTHARDLPDLPVTHYKVEEVVIDDQNDEFSKSLVLAKAEVSSQIELENGKAELVLDLSMVVLLEVFHLTLSKGNHKLSQWLSYSVWSEACKNFNLEFEKERINRQAVHRKKVKLCNLGYVEISNDSKYFRFTECFFDALDSHNFYIDETISGDERKKTLELIESVISLVRPSDPLKDSGRTDKEKTMN